MAGPLGFQVADSSCQYDKISPENVPSSDHIDACPLPTHQPMYSDRLLRHPPLSALIGLVVPQFGTIL